MRKRVLFGGVTAAVTAVAVAGVALAAGGGFGSPGTTTFHDVTATAEFFDAAGGVVFINADYGMQSFKTRGVNGPPVIVGPETVLNVSGNLDDQTPVFGCFVIPDSSFAVAPGLASATLNVDPSIEAPCPGLQIPAANGGRPGFTGVVPFAGGGGGGGGTTFTGHVVWTSNGVLTTSNLTIETRCQAATAHTTDSVTSTPTLVTGGVSLLDGADGQFGSLQDSRSKQVIASAFSSACFSA